VLVDQDFEAEMNWSNERGLQFDVSTRNKAKEQLLSGTPSFIAGKSSKKVVGITFAPGIERWSSPICKYLFYI
jgi:hypothetical protein